MQEILFARKEATLRRIECRRGKVLGIWDACTSIHPARKLIAKARMVAPGQRKRIGGHRCSEFPVKHARTWGVAVVYGCKRNFAQRGVSQEKGGQQGIQYGCSPMQWSRRPGSGPGLPS